MAEKAAPTPLDLIKLTTDYLARKGCASPRLDAEVLLAEALGLTRLALYLHYDKPLGEEEVGRYRELVRRRALGEPVAYITGKKEFWSLELKVCPGVLIPRPDTETLVEKALSLMGEAGSFLELGVGSGAVSLALLTERGGWSGVGVDIEEEPLAVSRQNAEKHGIAERLTLLKGDLYPPADPFAPFDLIVSNPPYIPSAAIPALERDVARFEPQKALDGGPDGLEIIRKIVAGAPSRLKAGGALLVEFGEGQGGAVREIFDRGGAFGAVELCRDLAGKERVACARVRG